MAFIVSDFISANYMSAMNLNRQCYQGKWDSKTKSESAKRTYISFSR